MAQPKKKKMISAENAISLRFSAFILWLIAIALEVVALLIFNGNINLKFMPTLWQFIAALALDLFFVILALTNKNIEKKTKAMATVLTIIVLLIGGIACYDFNPISEEEQTSAMSTITADVYWSPFGKVYHTHDDCQSLNQHDKLAYGSVELAISKGHTRLCAFCAKKDDITGVVTDKSVDDIELDAIYEEEFVESYDDVLIDE